MGKNMWLMKSEPDGYSYDDLVAEGEGTWDGVRNHRAANNLRAMQVGDQAFFYHSNIGLEIVGIVMISQAGLLDPTDPRELQVRNAFYTVLGGMDFDVSPTLLAARLARALIPHPQAVPLAAGWVRRFLSERRPRLPRSFRWRLFYGRTRV